MVLQKAQTRGIERSLAGYPLKSAAGALIVQARTDNTLAPRFDGERS
jgi:hypothetical protein